MKFNMQSVLEQAQKMQEEMDKAKTEIAKKTVTAEAGGGLVKVTMTGANEIVEIKLSKDVVNPDDIEMLEDLIVAAVNMATKSAADMAAAEMSRIAGMMPNIPGMNFNF